MEAYIITLLLADALDVTDNIWHDKFDINLFLLPLFTLNGKIVNPLLMNHSLLSRPSINFLLTLSPNANYACTFCENEGIWGIKTLLAFDTWWSNWNVALIKSCKIYKVNSSWIYVIYLDNTALCLSLFLSLPPSSLPPSLPLRVYVSIHFGCITKYPKI